jgi:hypothetical protein
MELKDIVYGNWHTGPKWICKIQPVDNIKFNVNAENVDEIIEDFKQLKIINSYINKFFIKDSVLIGIGDQDVFGKEKALICIDDTSTLWIIGQIPSGYWRYGKLVWWPGCYEVALIRQYKLIVDIVIRKLHNGGPSSLSMSLHNIKDYEFIARSGCGDESAFMIPRKDEIFTYPLVIVDGDVEGDKIKLINSFNKLRMDAGVLPSDQFYLN